MAINSGELQISSDDRDTSDEIILQTNRAVYGLGILLDTELLMKSLDYEVKAVILGSGALLCIGGMLKLLDAKDRQNRQEGRSMDSDSSVTSPEPFPA